MSANSSYLIGEVAAEKHRRGGEIPEDEFVALLGDFRRRGDIDDERNALLFGDLGDRGGLAGIEGADQELGAVADQLFGVFARGVDVRFGVAVHDRQIRQAERFEDRGGDVDAALAVLADARFKTGPRQQHADLERSTLCTHDSRRSDRGGGGCSGACKQAATGRHQSDAVHGEVLPDFAKC